MNENAQHNITTAVEQYSNRLLSFIRGRVNSDEDAEDILQDVWYQLSNLVNIDEIESISAWLYRVARNKTTDKYRKKSTSHLEDLSFTTEDGDVDFNDILLADNDDPEFGFFKELFWEELFASLDELPENQRRVFIWNELEDMTLQQIADKTNENLKTIISRKGYAVKHLRKKLQALYNELNNY
jgi:RNA polymerase sigma factor (sigma-70 family)